MTSKSKASAQKRQRISKTVAVKKARRATPQATAQASAATEPTSGEVVLTGEDIARFRDAHADRTREAIAKLDRLAVESEAQAMRIVVTNAK